MPWQLKIASRQRRLYGEAKAIWQKPNGSVMWAVGGGITTRRKLTTGRWKPMLYSDLTLLMVPFRGSKLGAAFTLTTWKVSTRTRNESPRNESNWSLTSAWFTRVARLGTLTAFAGRSLALQVKLRSWLVRLWM